MSETKKILIVDDDPDYVAAIRVLLENAGHQVLSAVNGREGLEEAKVHQPDLILLDVMMSERSEGFFTLHELRRVSGLSETPVIVISSIYSDQPVFRVSPEAGWLPADIFLPKPVDPGRLLEEVARLTARDYRRPKTATTAGRREI